MLHIRNIQSHTQTFHFSFSPQLPSLTRNTFFVTKKNLLSYRKKMASVTTQASAAVFRPCSNSKSRFLSGSCGKLNRDLSMRSIVSPSTSSFKVDAKKGEWLPGAASPAYLDGRLICVQINSSKPFIYR